MKFPPTPQLWAVTAPNHRDSCGQETLTGGPVPSHETPAGPLGPAATPPPGPGWNWEPEGRCGACRGLLGIGERPRKARSDKS